MESSMDIRCRDSDKTLDIYHGDLDCKSKGICLNNFDCKSEDICHSDSDDKVNIYSHNVSEKGVMEKNIAKPPFIEESEKPNICGNCGQIFSEVRQLHVCNPLCISKKSSDLLNQPITAIKQESKYSCMGLNETSNGHGNLNTIEVKYTDVRFMCNQRNYYGTFENTKDQTESKAHACGECGKHFSTKFAKSTHMQIHTGECPYKCSECGETFITQKNLNIHSVIHTRNYPFECDQPNYGYKRHTKLSLKNQTHFKHTGLLTRDYNEILSNQIIRNKHKRKHNDNFRFVCDQPSCNYACKKSKTLENHMRQEHSKMKPHICGECGKCFATKFTLKTHMRIHSGECPYKCGKCGEMFISHVQLKAHTVIHTGLYPFACDQPNCSYKCHTKHILKNHKCSTHTRFTCSRCGETFSNLRTRKTHICQHNANCKFVCGQPNCYYICKKKSTLENHMQNEHTETKPHVCEECGKTFATKFTKKTHMRIHTGECPYKCEDCGEQFNTRKKLNAHMFVHTKGYPSVSKEDTKTSLKIY